MLIDWYNEVHRKETCNIILMDDIQKYDEDELFCLRIRNSKVLFGGLLGKFKSGAARDKAYDDIKDALDAGVEEFEFRPGYYEHIVHSAP